MKIKAVLVCILIASIVCVYGLGDQENSEKLLTAIKTLNVGVDTPDDIIRKCGNTKGPLTKNMYGIIYSYGFFADKIPVSIDIVVSKITGKIKCIKVVKYGTTQEEVYSRGSLSEEPVIQTNNVIVSVSQTPDNPMIGQLYLNTTDSHFYGWNGKEWKQLDK
jgi:hypothetical protein